MMTLFVKCFVVGLLLFVAGCSDTPSSVEPRTSARKVRPAKSVTSQVKQEVKEVKDLFVYSTVGQRDPFESLLKKEVESREVKIPKTPLEKFDLGQFRVQAILIGKGAPRAMVSAPDGKNYILRPGLKIGKNNGVIKDITKAAILVEESTIDLAGTLVKGVQSMTISDKKTF